MDFFKKFFNRKVNKFVVPLGETLSFDGWTYGSVGYQYYIEVPEEAFSIEHSFKYLNPEKVHVCEGADRAFKTYILSPKRKGVFEIYEVKKFRGEIRERIKNVIEVI